MIKSNARRLAINTLFMYIRMILLMLLSLYMSRVILKGLGIGDFGTYNLVGSIVALFSSLRILFSSATQRFMNYEMGRNNEQQLSKIFSMSIIINLIISLLFVVFAELIGWWFFEYKINIDPSRLTAAQIVYQCSIASAVLTIMTTPYDAVIIAHEKMNLYAMISILEGVLKLLAAFSLLYFGGDRLILYGILMLIVSFIIRLINSIYCQKHYPESKFNLCWDKLYFKKMFYFAGWQMLGNTAFAISQNGLNMILNIFGGPAVNAARGIAFQVNESTNKLLASVTVVVNPYSTKAFAEGKIESLMKMFFFSSKIMFLIQLLLSIPIYLFIEDILKIWLGEVPAYTIDFVRIIIIYSLIRSLHGPVDTVFKSIGKIKYYQISEGVFLLLPIFISYLALYKGYNYNYAFYVVSLFELLNLLMILYIAKKQCNIDINSYIYEVVRPCILSTIIFVLVYICSSYFVSGYFLLIITNLLGYIMILVYMFFKGFNKGEILKIKEVVGKSI